MGLGISHIQFGNYTMVILLPTMLSKIQLDKLMWSIVIEFD